MLKDGIMDFSIKDNYSINDLVEIVETLRSPEGCPWDRKQTHASIRKNFIEETYEAVEAIDTDNMDLLKEELGDVLLQVLLHSQIASENGYFNFADVCDGISQKLVYRHPHVFGDMNAEDSEEALKNWDQMKKIEKGQNTTTDTLNQVSKALPALMYSEKVQKRAAKVGFDYENAEGAYEHLYKELEELNEAIEKKEFSDIYEEYGDVLFSMVNLSRFLSIDAEKSLYDATNKFVNRFSKLEKLANDRGIKIEESNLQELDILWDEVKKIK